MRDRQTDGRTETDRQIGRQICRQAGRQAGRQADRQTETNRQTRTDGRTCGRAGGGTDRETGLGKESLLGPDQFNFGYRLAYILGTMLHYSLAAVSSGTSMDTCTLRTVSEA